MNTKKYGPWIVALLLSVPLIYSVVIYPNLPSQIPTHFNIEGKPDAWGGPASIFLGPGIMGAVSIFIYALMTNLKSIDPKKYDASNDTLYTNFALITVAFLCMLSVLIIYATTHDQINIGNNILPLIGIAFAGLGWYMPKFKQNYFVGFKLPWTLENEDNWNETHKVAGKVWLIGGLFQAIASFTLSSKLGFICFITATAIMVIIPTIFSYRMFKNGNIIK
ncbi:MAG: hypothetical protein RL064_1072 [Bacteroidota bacterium]|jgi:uncharacterized membrane protein